MLMLTKQNRKDLPELYSQDDKPAKEVMVQVKFFNPTGGWTWYAT